MTVKILIVTFCNYMSKMCSQAERHVYNQIKPVFTVTRGKNKYPYMKHALCPRCSLEKSGFITVLLYIIYCTPIQRETCHSVKAVVCKELQSFSFSKSSNTTLKNFLQVHILYLKYDLIKSRELLSAKCRLVKVL